MGTEKWTCNACGEEYAVGVACDLCVPSAEPAPAPKHIEPPFYNAETGYVEDVTESRCRECGKIARLLETGVLGKICQECVNKYHERISND